MLTSLDFYKKYGDPSSKKFIKTLIIWDVPQVLEIGVIPKRIYCHPDTVQPFTKAFENLIFYEKVSELVTWDGCYNHRPIRGYEERYRAAIKAGDIERAMQYLSTHSWALSFDANAFENQLGTKGKFSKEFVKCFTDAGWDWGGFWQKRSDPMHFQLAA